MLATVLSVLATWSVVAASYIQLNGTDVTTTTILNPFSSGSQYIANVALLGANDILFAFFPTIEQCARLCAVTPGCAGYSYATSNECGAAGDCHLKYGPFPSPAYSSCWDSGINPQFTPYTFSAPYMKALCEDTPQCSSFSTTDGFLRAFAPNASLTSWLSNTTCGSSGSASVEAGSCFNPSSSYVVCNPIQASGYFVTMAAYALPPFLLAQACDGNTACAGYMATADGTHGWLLSWAPAAAYGTVALYVDNL